MYDYTQNPLYNPTMNPYLPQAHVQLAQPRQEVVKVNGEPGARAYPMGPNSSALLLDVSGQIVWAVTTDGAGYKTVAPYDITPHQDAPAPDFGGLEARIARLEEKINGGTSTSDPANAQRSSEQPADSRPRADQRDRR